MNDIGTHANALATCDTMWIKEVSWSESVSHARRSQNLACGRIGCVPAVTGSTVGVDLPNTMQRTMQPMLLVEYVGPRLQDLAKRECC